MSKLAHRLASAFALAAVVFTIGSARAEAQLFYVDAASTSPAAPYAAPETAATTIRDAYIAATNALEEGSASAAEIRVATGTYSETDFILDKPIAIVGATGNQTDVKIYDQASGKRAFTLSHADAKIANLKIYGKGQNTISGGGSPDFANRNGGGHVWMSDGTVENCHIDGGCKGAAGYNCGMGGNVYMCGGRLTRSKITGGALTGYFKSYGSGVYAEGGVVEDCFIYGNTSAAGEGTLGSGICAKGSATIVNCTIIKNSPSGICLCTQNDRAINCVMHANGSYDFTSGTSYAAGTYNGNYSHCAASVTNAACATWRVITQDDFAGYLSEDFSLSPSSSMIDFGTLEGVPASCSPVDFAGADRISGAAIDLGCFEFDQSKVSAGGSASTYGTFEGTGITFTGSALGGEATSYMYKWDFGDETPIAETASATCSHAYTGSGLFVAKVAASADNGTTWSDWFVLPTKIAIVPTTMYVDSHCETPTFPYKTKATAALSFADVFNAMTNNVSGGRPAIGGATIVVCEGTHTLTDVTLDAAITVEGETGDPNDVEIVDAVTGKRAFTISHADAVVRDLTISGSGINIASGDSSGGHIYMTAGLVEHCVIKDGNAHNAQYSAGFGGNIWMSGGTVLRCTITNGSGNRSIYGGAHPGKGSGIYAKGGLIDNCLLVGNGVSYENTVGAAIHAEGTTKIVNCTIVDNAKDCTKNVGGINVGANTVKVANSIIYHNGVSEFLGTATCFSHCAASVTNDACATWLVLVDGDFAGYAMGDYHLSAASLAVDYATDDPDWVPSPAATVDLDGFQRKSGVAVDLGCYEFDQSKVSAGGYVDVYAAFETSNIVFHASAKGGEGGPYQYRWDFGDGSEPVTTDDAAYDYAYPTSGLFTASVAASEDGGETWSKPFVFPTKIAVAPTTMFVDSHCETPTFPYATKDTAALSFADVLGAFTNNVSGGRPVIGGATIVVCEGSHNLTDVTLDKPFTIRGETGNPENVEIVDNVAGKRAFTITHADAIIKDLTISGKGWSGGNGSQAGHIYMTGGTVEHCIIKNGIAFLGIDGSGWGGNIWMSGGRVIRCQILNGKANSYDYGNHHPCYGDGIYAEGGLIENCLVAKCGHTSEMHQGGGIYAKGNTTISSCTVVDNLGDGSNGIYPESASVKIVNTVIYGNGAAAENNFANAVFSNYTHCASVVTNEHCANWSVITSDDFAAYLSGNYHPSTASRFLDVGTQDAALVPQPAATEDLDGFKRKSGPGIDLGCYELDQSVVTCSGYPLEYYAFETSNVVFHAAAKGGDSTDYTFRWDFGNGVTNLTKSGDYGYNYPSGGLFHIRLSASADGGETWSAWYDVEKSIMVTPKVIYVDSACTTPAAPYRSRETAATTIADALNTLTNQLSGGKTAMNGVEIQVYPGATGKYAETGFTLASGVTIRGMGETPEDVEIVDNVTGKRAFTITDAGAVVRDLTISGSGINIVSGDSSGGHIYMTAGLVEHCVIKDGNAHNGQYSAGFGGNIWMSGGKVSRCTITNGSGNRSIYGGAHPGKGSGIYAKGGLIDNCLLVGNGTSYENTSGAAIYAEGTAKIVNCTIVDNAKGCAINVGGINVGANTVKVANTIIYHNGVSEFLGTATCFSHCASSVTNASCATWLVIQNGGFAGYLGGDYHLSAATALIDAGTRDEAWVPAPQATEDLDGLMRVSGAEIDIGCYEFDLSKVSVGGYASTYGSFEASNVVFHASARGGAGAGFEYQWDFGNGETVVTKLSDYSYAYPTSGLFRVRVAAREQGSDEWSSWFETTEKMVVAPQVMYVDSKCATPTFPYKTKATAATSFADVFNAMTNNVSGSRPAMDGVTIVVCKGKHTDTDVTLDRGICVVGETGNPADVEIVDNVGGGKRAFTLTHVDAVVKNLTISGTGLNVVSSTSDSKAYVGGHVKITAGLVENCVIKGGRAMAAGNYSCGSGGNVYLSGGRLSRSVIQGGGCNYMSGGSFDSRGAGVCADGKGIVENCLILDNGHPGEKTSANGIHVADSAKVVNCTIIGNPRRGICIASKNAQVVNTVLYNNGGTLADETGGNEYTNRFFHCASTVANGGDAAWRVIDETAFWHYDRREKDLKFLRPAAGGGLLNAGTTWAEYQATGAASELDLLGNPRLLGKHLDIGAFEGAAVGGSLHVR